MEKLYYSEEGIITTKGENLATFKDVQDYICEGGEITEGVYEITEGIIEVLGEDEDFEIVLISVSNKNTDCKDSIAS